MDPVRWLRYRFQESGRPWWGSDLRCRHWQGGAFNTDWQCLLVWNHDEVEGLPHIYEPDLWPGGEHHETFMLLWKVYKKEKHLRGRVDSEGVSHPGSDRADLARRLAGDTGAEQTA